MKTIMLDNRISIYTRFHAKPSGKNVCTIYVRFHVAQNEIEMHETVVSTKVRCGKSQWNGSRIHGKKGDYQVSKDNAKLSEIESLITDALYDLKKRKLLNWREAVQFIESHIRPIIAPRTKMKACSEQKKVGTLQHLMDSYLAERNVTEGYKNKFKDLVRHATDFFQRDVNVFELDKKQCKEFGAWLHNRISHNSVMTYLNRLRTLLIYAVDLELIEQSPLPRKDIIKGYRPGAGINLTDTELLRLMHIPNTLNPGMLKMKNLFLFMCSTGLGLGDIRSLRKHHFVEVDGTRFISKDRNKTNEPCHIPLSPTAQKIWDEYFNWMDFETGITTPFEPFENIPSDAYCLRKFKELVSLAGIEKKVGTYTPRRTFATNYIRNGGNVYQLQKILGHTDIKTTMKYVHLAQNDLSRDAGHVYINSKFHNSKIE